MIIDKDSIVIDTISMAQYLTEAKFGYNKLWSSDSGRNLAGTQSGTLLGIFPKLSLTFRKLTQADLELLAPIMDKSNQQVTYYDPNKKQNITITTYSGDWSLICKSVGNKCSGVTCDFISIRKRA